MMALYIPMHPSSKIPMMAFCFRNSRANFTPADSAAAGTRASCTGSTCDVSCLIFPFFSQRREPVREERVGEFFAPERAVLDAGFGQGGIEVQHPDQPGPGAAPVRDGEDRARGG